MVGVSSVVVHDNRNRSFVSLRLVKGREVMVVGPVSVTVDRT